MTTKASSQELAMIIGLVAKEASGNSLVVRNPKQPISKSFRH
jgi:hypothetical protein